MFERAWPRIALFPLALAGLVVAGALALNLISPANHAESARIAEANQLVARAQEATARESWPQARDYAAKALSLNPAHVTGRLVLGLAYLNMNALDEAEAEFRRVLTLAKDDPASTAWAHNNLGVVFQRRGQLRLALQEYETALALDPFNGLARANLAEIRRYVR